MRKRSWTWLAILLLFLLAGMPLTQAKTLTPAPAPTPLSGSAGSASGDVGIMLSGTSPTGNPGTVYVGATPPNVDYNKPVLLFVHGKGGDASVWWAETMYHGTNDMYDYAYYNGYRTAFVDMYPEATMWVNGSMLKQQIDLVKSYYGVSQVTIVAHSKGGVDANTASAHYGAAPSIRRVVTLGTPHWGTPLADMAFSTSTWWLAILMGQTTDATYVMQTGYMEYFRSITDGLDPVPYYTLSGYKCGPVFSALWYGCMAISGEDDGVVPVWSARIPGGTHLKEGYWDHDEIRMGSRTWSTFVPVIQTAALPGPDVAIPVGDLLAMTPGKVNDASTAASRPQAPGNVILRGGEVNGAAAGQSFPVESGVSGATFTFYASSPDFKATLTGPDGSAYGVTMGAQVPADEVFAGAWVGNVEVSTPAAGAWKLDTASANKAGYLMIATLESPLKATLDAGQGVAIPGGRRDLTVGLAPAQAVQQARVEGTVGFSGQRPYARPEFAATGGAFRGAVQLPAASGIHNVTLTVTGTLADGSAFERTLVTSFAAIAPAERGHWQR